MTTSPRVTQAELVALRAALRALVPVAFADRLRTGVRAHDERDVVGLKEIERAAMVNAIGPRRREFASGRALLRELLGTDDAIAVLPSRAPALPPGVVASLAHDDAVAVAVAFVGPRAGDARALGIDVEPEGSASDVASAILRPEEAGLDPTFALCAKEAAYKAWSALGGPILGHHDIAVTLDAPDAPTGTFVAVVLEVTTFRGSFARVAGRVLALVIA